MKHVCEVHLGAGAGTEGGLSPTVRRRQPGTSGFTLTEMMVATAIFGLLMALVLGVHLAAERQ